VSPLEQTVLGLTLGIVGVLLVIGIPVLLSRIGDLERRLDGHGNDVAGLRSEVYQFDMKIHDVARAAGLDWVPARPAAWRKP
jgi:hypothetical protein